MKVNISKTGYIYLFPTIAFSKSDWKHNLKRAWIVWLNYQICFYEL